MSLADQQWCPTSVQVTVLQARGLRIKGKSGTNDAYAVMQVGKEKYQTSVVEKSVAPVWKEEAAFDLPQLQQGGGGGTERSTLHVHVLHRALVGPDKLLGQAVINLLQLSEDKTRNKTEWFKLLDKTGKADKDRGEVLVDIQFMRNNMTASMFDLSAAGKSRSRLGKFKDKVRGKKKESDATSNVVPSFTQVLTDSEEEGNEEGEVAAGKDEKKKKHKIKSLFSPKSNLQRNMSQSMSVLPAKNSSLSGSQSSGLNVDSSEGKKKFKFMIHKRSGSSDSKDSSSGHQKHGAAEQSNLCINGSHIYCEEPQNRTSRIGSNFSLASSGHGSMEDVPESSPPSVDSLRAVRQYSPWTEEEEETAEVENMKEDELKREEEERIRVEEEERRRKEEERVRRQEEEVERLAEEKRRQERRKIEEEEIRQREEEERIRMNEERAQEERRRQEERKSAEERRRLEEEERKRIEEEKVRKEEEERIRRKEEERAQEERRRQEEEEKARREEEERERLAEEKRILEEQERRRIEEDEKRQREEEERIRIEEERAQEERRRQEEEERARKEEKERERLAEEKRKLEQERKRIEEEEKRQREEEEKIRMEEEKAQEERRRQEEEHKLAEEKRRLEEEERKRAEEEKVRKDEEERVRREEERVQEEKRRQEEEEMVRRQEDERVEKRKLEDQERRRREEDIIKKEEEEKARREKEEFGILALQKRKVEEEERKRFEVEEKIKKEEEERVRVEEQRRRKEEEEESVRRQEKEREKLAGEKRILEEQERRRIEEEEQRQREEEERIRKEDEMRQEEEERARKEKEEHERLVEEKMRQEEQERRRIEQEERLREEEQERIKMEKEQRRRQEEEEKRIIEEEAKIKREEEERIRSQEKAEEEARKLEKERVTRDAAEQKKRENKTKHKAAETKSKVKSPAKVTSTNPFDENFSNNPFEESPNSPAGPESSTATQLSTVQQRSQSAVLSLGSKIASTDEKDLICSQREKRPAPQPPGRNQAERQNQKEQDGSTRHLAQMNKQSKDKDVKTISVFPQRSVQMIAPLSRSPTDAKNTQSLTQSSTTKGTTSVAKHSKRPAPSRPRSVEEGPLSEPKTALSSDGKKSSECGPVAKQKPTVYGLNPFEDDEDENELTNQDNTTTNTGSMQWPPAVSQAADKDATSQTKIKSSKLAHAPPLPAKKAATLSTSINQITKEGHATDDTGVIVPGNSATDSCDPEHVQETPLQESQPVAVQSGVGETGKKEGPPTSSRRLQPVKPLNPLGQQSVSVAQGEIDNKSTGILCEVQEKTKVNGTGLKGPYSQLTREELICLVLKQENQLSERNKKISELEQYIDNLLVRVMEEKPSILMSMNSVKKSV